MECGPRVVQVLVVGVVADVVNEALSAGWPTMVGGVEDARAAPISTHSPRG